MDRSTLYKYMNQVIEDDIVIGMVSAIVTKESRELFFVGESEEHVKATTDTIYDLASVSKVVGTTSAILKLLEEGLITLDTQVKTILPKYRYDSTILDLLTHQSGLPADDKAYRDTVDRDTFIEFLYNIELTYEPNTKVEYSDFGFNLLGLIIEHFKGDINDYLQEILFKPLMMHNTTYLPNTLNQALIAPTENHPERGLIKGEVMDGKAHKLNGLSGNAGLFSNINDLSNFVQMILNGGTYLGQEIFKTETVDLLKNNYTEGLNIRRTLGYGLRDDFFAQGSLSGDHIIYHTGFSGPMLMIDFDNELAIVNLVNRTYPSRSNEKILTERNTLIDNIYKYFKK